MRDMYFRFPLVAGCLAGLLVQAAAAAPEEKPALHGVVGEACFRPGETITIEGRGLDAAAGFTLILDLPEAETVEVLDWRGSRLTARLPTAPWLNGGGRFRLALLDRQGRPVDTPGLQVALCGETG